jgi:hypothetical protein
MDYVQILHLLFIYLFFAVLQLELRAYTLNHSTSLFFRVLGIFEIRSRKKVS